MANPNRGRGTPDEEGAPPNGQHANETRRGVAGQRGHAEARHPGGKGHVPPVTSGPSSHSQPGNLVLRGGVPGRVFLRGGVGPRGSRAFPFERGRGRRGRGRGGTDIPPLQSS